MKKYSYREYNINWELEHKKHRAEYARKRIARIKKETGRTTTDFARKNAKIKRDKIRESFITMYGGVCSCCNESNMGFLTIEHVLGQKGVARGKRELSTNAYKNALKEYRPDVYDVLCFNCNCGKSRNGGICPHRA